MLTICGDDGAEHVVSSSSIHEKKGSEKETFLRVFLSVVVVALSRNPHRISIELYYEPVFFFFGHLVTDHLMRKIDTCRLFFSPPRFFDML